MPIISWQNPTFPVVFIVVYVKTQNIKVEKEANPQIVKVTTSKEGILLNNQINKLRLKQLTWWEGCHLDFIFSSAL